MISSLIMRGVVPTPQTFFYTCNIYASTSHCWAATRRPCSSARSDIVTLSNHIHVLFVGFEPRPARLEGLRGELLPTTSIQSHQQVTESAATLVHAFVTSRVDYCNAVYAMSPPTITNTLQRAMNAAARVLSDTGKCDRGLKTILHDELHWLNVHDRIECKLGVMGCA